MHNPKSDSDSNLIDPAANLVYPDCNLKLVYPLINGTENSIFNWKIRIQIGLKGHGLRVYSQID